MEWIYSVEVSALFDEALGRIYKRNIRLCVTMASNRADETRNGLDSKSPVGNRSGQKPDMAVYLPFPWCHQRPGFNFLLESPL